MKSVVILLSNIYECGGVQRVVTIIANQLIKTGKYQITLLSIFKTGAVPYFELDERINCAHIYQKPFNLKSGYFKVVFGIRKYIIKNNVNIIINAGIGYSSMVKLATANNREIKTIGWEHQSFFFGKPFGLEWIGKRVACKMMDAVVVLTKTDYKKYTQNIQKIIHIEQIYNPVDVMEKSNLYRSDEKKIISCGSLVPQKGFDYAIKVSKIIFKKHPDWQWHIYGDGADRLMLEDKIRENNLNNNLILKGYCNNLNEKYKEYSIYVMTSRHEGFPMVLIEAQSNLLPIVSFDCDCGPNELIIDNINGYLIDCFEIEQMAEKICNLINDRDKRIKYSSNAQLDHEKLSLKDIGIQWEKLLDNI